VSYTIQHGYCTLDDLKNMLRLTDDSDDERLSWAIDAASRMIENATGRRFYQDTTASARTFVPLTPFRMDVDDFFDLTDLVLQTDPAGDGTFTQTFNNPTLNADGSLTGGDFQLEPLNGLNEGQVWPYERILDVRSLIFPIYGGISYPIAYAQALIKVTTKWGWNYVPSDIAYATKLQARDLFKSDDVVFGATAFAEVGIVRQKAALNPTVQILISKYREAIARVA
jgi:hypothetical protein